MGYPKGEFSVSGAVFEYREPLRGCGYRKIGAYYIVTEPVSIRHCKNLPYPLFHQKHFRGIKRINPWKLINTTPKCETASCPVCYPPNENIHVLMFAGESYYTQNSIITEAIKLGISKRIRKPVDWIDLNRSILYLAYNRTAIQIDDEGSTLYMPAIITAQRIRRIEHLITSEQATKEYIEELISKGLTPVIIPKEYEHRHR